MTCNLSLYFNYKRTLNLKKEDRNSKRSKNKNELSFTQSILFAEREGFEPSVPVKVHTLSRRAS